LISSTLGFRNSPRLLLLYVAYLQFALLCNEYQFNEINTHTQHLSLLVIVFAANLKL